MRVYQLLIFLLLSVWLAACGGSYDMQYPSHAVAPGADVAMEASGDYDDEGYAYGEMEPEDPSYYAQGGAPPPPPPPPLSQPPSQGQPPEAKPDVPPGPDAPEIPTGVQKKVKALLIYRADYTLAVFETAKSIDGVQKLAEDAGGYLVERTDDSITVRVPAAQYRDALAAIDSIGDVLHREESVQDVTEQFYDTLTRLENARALRDRIQQLLERAETVEDALKVERELSRITADIEAMEGRLKRLRELIAFSTITVRFQRLSGDQINKNVELPFPWLNRLGLGNLLSL